MSYRDRFHDYGATSYGAEVRPWILFRDPAKLETSKEVTRADKTAAQDIATLEALLADLREYRQDLAGRYAQLETMAYTDRLELERRPSYGSGGVTYYIRQVRRYEDGAETITAHESYEGKRLRDALKRFEELKKQRPGIEVRVDIERRSWER